MSNDIKLEALQRLPQEQGSSAHGQRPCVTATLINGSRPWTI
ncbi:MULTISPECIES: hypothetical protein [unclassified Nonomuraea]